MKILKVLPAGAMLALALVAVPASALTVVYQAVLTGPAEAPPNTSGGIGVGLVTFDDVLNTMRVQVTFAGLTGNVTNSHIHCCSLVALTGTAGVATVTPSFTGFPAGTTFGSYDFTYNMALATSFNAAYVTANGGTAGSAFAALASGAAAGMAYFNIHSTAFGGGEIRGFLTTAVPEPSTYALMLGGLALIGARLRKQRQA